MDQRKYWNVVVSSIGGFLGQNLMQVVDLLFCRGLGAEGTATVGAASAICAWFLIIGLGIMYSLEYYIPHSLGAKNEERAQSFYYSGFVFAIVVGLLSGGGVAIAGYYSTAFGIQESIIPKLQSFCFIIATSYLPIFVAGAGRVELQARGFPREMTLAYVYGNVLNAFLNWVLVLGNLGFPALGTDGSALASVLARYGIMLYILIRVYQVRRSVATVVRIREVQYVKYIKEIINLGFPTALHMIFEIGAFALVGTLSGQFSSAKTSAHAIAISIASFVFMVPLGMSSAASLMMSEANGAKQPQEALHWGRLTIKLGMFYAVCMSLIMILFRVELIKAYTTDSETIAVCTQLLFIAAVFQFGDAMQVILAGCIRGFGETKIQAQMNGIGHWVIGIPLGLYLGYKKQMDVTGFWIGLCVGLFSVALGLYWKWRNLSLLVPLLTAADHRQR